MNKTAFALMFLLSLCICSSSVTALTEPFWIDGSISSPITEDIFDENQFWVFNFTVTNTNRGDLVALNSEVQVLCWKSIESGFVQGGFYNLSGSIVDVQMGDKPLGAFVVSAVNTQAYSDWTGIMWDLINIFSGLLGGIATMLAEVIFVVFGVVIPEILLTALIIGFLAWFIIKNLKSLSFFIIIVVCFLVFSGGANIIRLLLVA